MVSFTKAQSKDRNCTCVCSVAQSCPTLGDSMDCSLPGSSVHGIFQARTLEQIAISYSRGSSRDQTHVLCKAVLYLSGFIGLKVQLDNINLANFFFVPL